MTSMESFNSFRTRSQNSRAVLGIAQRAGADRADLAGAVTIGDREEVAQDVDRGVGRFGIEPTGFR